MGASRLGCRSPNHLVARECSLRFCRLRLERQPSPRIERTSRIQLLLDGAFGDDPAFGELLDHYRYSNGLAHPQVFAI